MEKRYQIDLEACCRNLYSAENTLQFLKPENLTHYVFIRLYDEVYKTDKPYLLDHSIKFGIDTFSENSPEGNYNHAGIDFNLDDGYYGINIGPNEPAFRMEYCTRVKPDEVYDMYKSNYGVYAYPVTADGYNKIKNALLSYEKNNKFKYDVSAIPIAAFLLTKYKVKNALGLENFWARDKPIKLVCSTFVIHVLSLGDPSLENWIKTKKININNFSPLTIAELPRTKLLFKGTWANYNKDVARFVQRNNEFKKYL